MAEHPSSTHLPPSRDEAVIESIEVLGDTDFSYERAVTLRGDAARGITDGLSRATAGGLDLLKKSRGRTVYELVPSEATRAGLADGTLRWATPKNGDASVLIKNKNTGRVAGHGELRQAKPKPASVLGPAVWQAMAVATQQHYLSEINEKLAHLDAKLDEVLARLVEADRAPLTRAKTLADRTAAALLAGERVSAERVRELRAAADRVDEVWNKLLDETHRHIGDYREGTTTAADVEQSFGLLLKATEALISCADVTVNLPHRDADELASIAREEGERILSALAQLRAIGDQMCQANSEWAKRWRAFHAKQHGKKKLFKTYQTVRPIKRLRKPKQRTLEPGVWKQSQLLTGATRPIEKLLVEVSADGSIRVAAA